MNSPQVKQEGRGRHCQKLTMATNILESAPWSMVKMAIIWSNFMVYSMVFLL